MLPGFLWCQRHLFKIVHHLEAALANMTLRQDSIVRVVFDGWWGGVRGEQTVKLTHGQGSSFCINYKDHLFLFFGVVLT